MSFHAIVNWKYQRCQRSIVGLEHPFIIGSLFLKFGHLQGIVAEICSGVYRRLGQIPLYRKNDCWPVFQNFVLQCQVLPHLIDLLFFHEGFLQIKVIILVLSLYLYKLLIIFLHRGHLNCYVWSHKTTFLIAHAVLNVEFTSTWRKCWKIYDFPTITQPNWVPELMLW